MIQIYGQFVIQTTMPAEDPVRVGSLWADTSTNTLKQCTSVSPYTFTTIGGSGVVGDVDGPASATDSAVALFDGTTGKLLKDSAKTLPTGAIVGTSDVQTLTNKQIVGGTGTTSTLTLQTTTGVGAVGADVLFLVGNNGATEAMRILNNGRVGIGTAAPAGPFEAVATTTSPVVGTRIQNTSNANQLSARKARGTPSVPTKVLSGDGIGGFGALGYEETTPSYRQSGTLQFAALEDFTSTATGTQMTIGVAPVGSVTVATQLAIRSDSLTLGSCVAPAATGKRYLVIDTNGVVTSQSAVPVGT